MATTKKTTGVKKTAATAAKKAVKGVASKVVEAAVTSTAVKAAKSAAKTTKAAVAKKKYMYIFFNCNDNKDAHSMNARYNNEVFSDTVAGRKALLQKVKDEVSAGRVNVSDKAAVENDILKGNPVEASSKIQYGDIERMVVRA